MLTEIATCRPQVASTVDGQSTEPAARMTRPRLPEAPGQGHLFDTESRASTPPEPDVSDPSDHVPAKHRKGHGRRPIGDHLPRRDVLHDVPEDDRTCTCGRAKTKIGED